MKKLIAVLIALAMVLSMSVMSFAKFAGKKSPAEFCDNAEKYNQAIASNKDIQDQIKAEKLYYDEENGKFMSWDDAWTAYYKHVLANASDDPGAAVTEIVDSVSNEYVEPGDAITKVGEAAMDGVGGDGESGDLSGVVSDIIEQIKDTVGGEGGEGSEVEPVSTEAYVEELKALINSGESFETISKKIGKDFADGKITASQLPEIAQGLTDLIEAGEIESNETVQQIIGFIKGLGNIIGGGDGEDTSFPDFSDVTLPNDEGNSESGSFLDTILNIIGSIGNIFNPDAGDEPTDEPSNPADPGTTDTPTEIPDTGDVSFVAVAAVAAVAGVALVLTRKKNDAE